MLRKNNNRLYRYWYQYYDHRKKILRSCIMPQPIGRMTAYTNMISHMTIPEKFAITIDRQVYDARTLSQWFAKSRMFILPHSRRRLTHDEIRRIDMLVRGSRPRNVRRRIGQRKQIALGRRVLGRMTPSAPRKRSNPGTSIATPNGIRKQLFM